MATVLVVANETLGGRQLIEAVKARAAKGDAEFVVDRAAEPAASPAT